MDLPTYTSIWRIEKRLYKLYDFRLPMPLPIGQIGMFTAITVPYVVLLQVLGLPFSHTLIWLYILPPGLLTWLVTRPVLESKRLPELIKSQLRYLAEPRVMCRMAPPTERDVIMVTGKIWRSRAHRPAAIRTAAFRPAPAAAPSAAPESGRFPTAPAEGAPGEPVPQPAEAQPQVQLPRPAPVPVRRRPDQPAEVPSQRPAVTVVGTPAQAAPPAVERALAGPSARQGNGRPGRVTVVPGGHRPGTPGQLQRDWTRAMLPLGGPGRIVVLGCTVGAGQTSTALLAGEVLASLRSGDVAVLDLNPGARSLTRRAVARPALSQAGSLGPSRLVVLARDWAAAERDRSAPDLVTDPGRDALSLEQAGESYEVVLADPSTAAVPRLLAIADLLVLVAPASAAAAGAITMTFEWLQAHGQDDLAANSVMVLNGVSRRSLAHVEQAERVCAGRCRAIVRVPWDDQVNSQAPRRAHPHRAAGQHWAGLLAPGTVAAYTALAGVLVAALAGPAEPGEADLQAAHAGQALL